MWRRKINKTSSIGIDTGEIFCCVHPLTLFKFRWSIPTCSLIQRYPSTVVFRPRQLHTNTWKIFCSLSIANTDRGPNIWSEISKDCKIINIRNCILQFIFICSISLKIKYCLIKIWFEYYLGVTLYLLCTVSRYYTVTPIWRQGTVSLQVDTVSFFPRCTDFFFAEVFQNKRVENWSEVKVIKVCARSSIKG